MSTYKVSYDVLAQQSDLLKNLATKINTYGSDIQSTASSLATNTAFTDFCSDLKILCKHLEEMASNINACSALIGTIQESYQSSESASVKRAQETKAYKQDCYKNPVVIVVQDSSSNASPTAGYSSSMNYTSGQNATGTHEPEIQIQNAYFGNGDTDFSSATSSPLPNIEIDSASMGAGATGAILGAGAVLGAQSLKKKKNNSIENATTINDTSEPNETDFDSDIDE